MTATDYCAYLGALNARRFDALDAFVDDHVTHNGVPMTRAGYCAMIGTSVATVPDLHFSGDVLLVEGDKMAARVALSGTPQHPFMGAEPTGRPIAIAEHVFYQLREGRISEVWSLMERDAVAVQLAA